MLILGQFATGFVNSSRGLDALLNLLLLPPPPLSLSLSDEPITVK